MDFFHVCEYVWEVARTAYRDPEQQQDWVKQQQDWVKQQSERLKQSRWQEVVAAAQQLPQGAGVEEAVTALERYLTNHQSREAVDRPRQLSQAGTGCCYCRSEHVLRHLFREKRLMIKFAKIAINPLPNPMKPIAWTVIVSSLAMMVSAIGLSLSPVQAQVQSEETPPLDEAEASDPSPAAAPTTDPDKPDEAEGTVPAAAPTPASNPVPATPNPAPTPPVVRATPTLDPDSVTDEQVVQLVEALLEIEPLLRKASTDLDATTDPAERQQIEQQFESEATEIVQAKDLTVEQYVQLMNLANANPVFGQRVSEQIDLATTEDAETSEDPSATAEPSDPDTETEADDDPEAVSEDE